MNILQHKYGRITESGCDDCEAGHGSHFRQLRSCVVFVVFVSDGGVCDDGDVHVSVVGCIDVRVVR